MNELNSRKNISRNNMLSLMLIVVCIGLNFGCSKLVATMGLPLYLDNVGTVIAASLGGYLPGILTAILTNTVNYFVDETSIYYAALSAAIAITITIFTRKGRFHSFLGIIELILFMALIGGGLGSVITWFLSGPATDGIYYDLLESTHDALGTGTFLSHVISTTIMDVADKTITVVLSFVIMMLIPKALKERFWLNGWRQSPVSDEELKELYGAPVARHTLSTKIALALIMTSVLVAFGIIFVSASIFSDYSRTQHERLAGGLSRLVADEIDPEMVDAYIAEGENAPGYKETEDLLYEIRNSADDIEYVYVYKIEEDGCHVVFDLDTEDMEGGEPGEIVPFDESFKDLVPDLLAGKEIEPIETNDTYGWLFTVYTPVRNSKGETVCYAAVDIAVHDMMSYVRDFIIRVILLFLGFFILILFTGIWVANFQLILPINSIATRANEFAFEDVDGDNMVDGLERIKSLDIRTGDEVENLYNAICKMTEDSVNYTNSIKEQAESISDLQRGLIMTMADMVEGRDSDTGNHVRKTAAYTRIIMDGLKRLGYYKDQLTDKFVYDVERSAPLHDIGKISISDVILNKPGKLTDEEYEIMKTHTTAGRDLLNQVIETVNGESYLEEGRNLSTYHHEKWNGMGYPEGLSGEDIPLSARIMAIADVFDALSSRRVYKPAMPFDKAVDIIRQDSGSHFDPKCVEAFLDSIDEVKAVLDYYNELEAEGETVRGNEIDDPEDKK